AVRSTLVDFEFRALDDLSSSRARQGLPMATARRSNTGSQSSMANVAAASRSVSQEPLVLR
ncbi:MAG TPA: hypothetical protein VHI72_18730, partial [Hyphomicrobiaceae bacterium]|nr:hypothetical protein [Hyphomicrobiaceae bacterium]